MPLDNKAIIKQIDDVLSHNAAGCVGEARNSVYFHVMLAALRRLAPSGSSYEKRIPLYESIDPALAVKMTRSIEELRGMLGALRADYEAGHLQSVVELVHADIFADFHDMAVYLVNQKYKDAAAVIAGSVLEAHLRKLCQKNSIDTLKADGSPKKADALNAELAGKNVYSKVDQKGVTHWLGIRNDAAHGNYSAYTQEQADLMIQQVRDFAARYPA